MTTKIFTFIKQGSRKQLHPAARRYHITGKVARRQITTLNAGAPQDYHLVISTIGRVLGVPASLSHIIHFHAHYARINTIEEKLRYPILPSL